jgi:hypothetical protein
MRGQSNRPLVYEMKIPVTVTEYTYLVTAEICTILQALLVLGERVYFRAH